MRIFHWEAKVAERYYIADGYVLAENREEAEDKIKSIPIRNQYAVIQLDDSDYEDNGYKFDNNGIAIRYG